MLDPVITWIVGTARDNQISVGAWYTTRQPLESNLHVLQDTATGTTIFSNAAHLP